MTQSVLFCARLLLLSYVHVVVEEPVSDLRHRIRVRVAHLYSCAMPHARRVPIMCLALPSNLAAQSQVKFFLLEAFDQEMSPAGFL